MKFLKRMAAFCAAAMLTGSAALAQEYDAQQAKSWMEQFAQALSQLAPVNDPAQTLDPARPGEYLQEYEFGTVQAATSGKPTAAQIEEIDVSTAQVTDARGIRVGMTLNEALLKLYEKYGYYRDGVKSMTMKGLEGMARIQRIMKTFRENTPQELGGYKVVMAKDYQTQVFRNLETGEESGSPLPVSDVLHYTLEDGTWVCIRPSGTEPKLKFYIGVKADGLQAAQDKVDALDADIEAKVAEIA